MLTTIQHINTHIHKGNQWRRQSFQAYIKKHIKSTASRKKERNYI